MRGDQELLIRRERGALKLAFPIFQSPLFFAIGPIEQVERRSPDPADQNGAVGRKIQAVLHILSLMTSPAFLPVLVVLDAFDAVSFPRYKLGAPAPEDA